MASPLAHIAVGAAIAVVLAPRAAPRGYFLAAIGLALVPDLLLNFSGDWGALLTKPVAVQTASSVLFAVMIGAGVSGLFRAFAGRRRFGHLNTNSHSLSFRRGFVIFTAVFLGSAIVNGFAAEPLFFWWPFEAEPYVPGADVLQPWFPNPLRWGFLQELIFVALPALVIACAVALFRERISKAPKIPEDPSHETAKRLAK